MRTLVYKRTHTGDPSAAGDFGCNGCMGRVRAWPFEAVIGVGGIGPTPVKYGIARKVTWIGIGPHSEGENLIITFDHFELFDAEGPDFCERAPNLSARIYDTNVRTAMTFTPEEQREVEKLLKRAEAAPPSSARGPQKALTRLVRRRVKAC